MEHRRSDRHKIQVQARVANRRLGTFFGEVIELSTQGAFVASPQAPLPPNAPVTITLEANQYGPRLNMKIRAMVVHNTNAGFGIQFEEMEPSQQRVLNRFVHWLGQAASDAEKSSSTENQRAASNPGR